MTDDEKATRDFVAFKVERVHSKLTAQATKLLAERCGLTPRQWWIIADLMAEAPETATELARISDVDKGLLSRNLKTLKEKGLVEMRRDPSDQRQQLIALTEAGRAKHAETLPLMRARNQHLTAGVSPEDMRTTMDVLSALEKAASTTVF